MLDHNLLLTLETVPHELGQSKDVQKKKEGGEREKNHPPLMLYLSPRDALFQGFVNL